MHKQGQADPAGCAQDDIVHEDLTVHEQLIYSARLRGNRTTMPRAQVTLAWRAQSVCSGAAAIALFAHLV